MLTRWLSMLLHYHHHHHHRYIVLCFVIASGHCRVCPSSELEVHTSQPRTSERDGPDSKQGWGKIKGVLICCWPARQPLDVCSFGLMRRRA
ncbi:hypothetical protein BD289DRAFT_422442 [Coniella lustricola]|uniref:Uncharacterized protein n=1 Tax=Coniella lustricola TaxID=2025994 RepID=A0A2T3AKY7_9PEZI|nr:hypothetical protein BD289DRAFT_422442 [Coniella lustricola]